MLKDRDGYYSDAPIVTPEHDAFGRDRFAERMATVVDQMATQSQSSVAALVGPWGSGKSSVFNLFSKHLEERDSGWKVRRFDPWLFSDVDSLLASYFSELLTVMPKGDKGRSVRDRIGSYAKKVAPLGKLTAALGFDTEAIIKVFGEILSAGQSVDDQRRELETELSELDFKVLVIMDDMDRLQPDELMIVLKVIRLIGDLPNVHYLLAYDERTLLDVLMGTPIGSGVEERAAQYLDKIVQVRFDLPPLTDSQEEELFDDGVLGVFTLAGAHIDEAEFRRLGTFFDSHMEAMLRVPRRMNKYLAQLSAFLDADVVQELNVIDFAILTYFRTFYGPVYNRLPYWKDSLTGYRLERLGKRENIEESRQEWNTRLNQAVVAEQDKPSILAMLAHLFPQLASLRVGYSAGGVDSNRLLAGRHLAAREYFDRYFQFQVPDDDISDALVSAAIDDLCGAASRQSETERVIELLDSEPVKVLAKIRSLIQARPCEQPARLVRLLGSRYASFDVHGARRHRSAREMARYVAFEALSRAQDEARQAELAYGQESYDLDFGIDLAFMFDRNDVGSADQSNAYISRILERCETHFEQQFSTLSNVEYNDFDIFKSWGHLADKGKARSYAQAKIDSGQWDIKEYLTLLSNTRMLVGVDNPKPYLGDVDADYLASFIGIKFAIEALGDELARDIPDLGINRWIEYPSDTQRLDSVILALQEVSRQIAKEESAITDEHHEHGPD